MVGLSPKGEVSIGVSVWCRHRAVICSCCSSGRAYRDGAVSAGPTSPPCGTQHRAMPSHSYSQVLPPVLALCAQVTAAHFSFPLSFRNTAASLWDFCRVCPALGPINNAQPRSSATTHVPHLHHLTLPCIIPRAFSPYGAEECWHSRMSSHGSVLRQNQGDRSPTKTAGAAQVLYGARQVGRGIGLDGKK